MKLITQDSLILLALFFILTVLWVAGGGDWADSLYGAFVLILGVFYGTVKPDLFDL